jgi:outer membrane protein insertion porin family
MWMGLQQETPPAAPPTVRTEGRVIDRVTFEGLQTVDPSYAHNIARISAGSLWDREEIARACARLSETGKFEGSPFAEAREEDGRLVLVFVAVERPFVEEVTFIGNEKFKSSDLLGEIEIGVGSAISEFLVNQSKEAILRKYREAGYAFANVEVDEELLDNERRLVFRISEGPRIKVRRIVFEGNQSFGRLELNSKIETSTYIWIFRTGAFDEETAQRDVAALKKYYNDRGYLNAQVGYRTEIENETDLTLTFQIEEGLVHYIKSITFEGNSVYDADRLASLMRLKTGEPIDADILTEDRKRILDEYGSHGYIYAEVTTTHVFDEEDGFVNLTVSVTEREQFRFGRVVVRGNRHTRDKVVRRELRFYPEELYDTVATRQAEQRLVETRLFKEATITPQGELPGVRDALVDVVEDDTTQILFGVGVTSNNGLVGSITFEQRNFDLFDWPRDSREFFRGRSFRGAGQTLRVMLEPGTELNRGSIEFREPYLLDMELGYNLSAYLFERGRGPYDEQRIGFTTSIDKRFREGLLKDWAAELAARVEMVDIDDVEPFSARDIEDVEGDSWLTSLKGTLVRDKTDSRWLPSEGNRLRLSWEQAGALGGDYTFSKLLAEYDQYYTLSRDRMDRKHIAQVGASVGQILGDAPVFERFYAGGMGSVRGFEFRGITPRDGFRDDPVGGDFLVLTNAQYSFPLVGKTVRGVAFTDMGTVEEDFRLSSWRASVGVGARIYIKYFGPIPLSFDVALPVAKDDDDDLQWFNFSFGTSF